MSRIESGKITLSERVESLPDIVQGIRDIVLADARAKQHRFLIDTAEVRNKSVYCDRLYLNRVLLNLTSNAIKYTHPGGTISLRVEQKPTTAAGYGTFEFRVKDNGVGMSEDFVATIFDPFTREEDSMVSGIQGTGLGMTITRSIVQTMGGRISVFTKKGEGTEFVVTLDLKLPEGKSSDPAIPKRKGPTSRGKEPNGEKRDFSLKGKRVLMVDDSKLNLKIGVLLLQELGMVIDTAPNGQIAVDMVREKGVEAYDFILMDVQDARDGWIRGDGRSQKAPGRRQAEDHRIFRQRLRRGQGKVVEGGHERTHQQAVEDRRADRGVRKRLEEILTSGPAAGDCRDRRRQGRAIATIPTQTALRPASPAGAIFSFSSSRL